MVDRPTIDTQNEKRKFDKNRSSGSSRTETTNPAGRFPSESGMQNGIESSPQLDEQGRVIEGSEYGRGSSGMGISSGSSATPAMGMESSMSSGSLEGANVTDASGITVDVELRPSYTGSSDSIGASSGSFSEQTVSMRDRADQLMERSREFASRAREMSTDLAARARELPERSRELAGRLDSHARANPWLHLGIAGFTGLALGYLVGRNQASSRSSSFMPDDEFAVATVTVTTTEMGRGYEDFDDALDE